MWHSSCGCSGAEDIATRSILSVLEPERWTLSSFYHYYSQLQPAWSIIIDKPWVEQRKNRTPIQGNTGCYLPSSLFLFLSMYNYETWDHTGSLFGGTEVVLITSDVCCHPCPLWCNGKGTWHFVGLSPDSTTHYDFEPVTYSYLENAFDSTNYLLMFLQINKILAAIK